MKHEFEKAVNKCPIAIAETREYLVSCNHNSSQMRLQVILVNPLQNCYRFLGLASILLYLQCIYKA